MGLSDPGALGLVVGVLAGGEPVQADVVAAALGEAPELARPVGRALGNARAEAEVDRGIGGTEEIRPWAAEVGLTEGEQADKSHELGEVPARQGSLAVEARLRRAAVISAKLDNIGRARSPNQVKWPRSAEVPDGDKGGWSTSAAAPERTRASLGA